MIRIISSLFFSVLLFTGCITKEIPSYETYSLLLNEDTSKNTTIKKNSSIKIEEPKALRSINTTSILYSKKAYQQNEYVLSKWSDTPSKMVQKIISEKLSQEKSFSFVSTPEIKISTDYKLNTKIIKLLHQFDNDKSYALLSIKAYLTDNKTGQIAVKNFEYRTLAENNNAYGFVKGMNDSINMFSTDLSIWLEKTVR